MSNVGRTLVAIGIVSFFGVSSAAAQTYAGAERTSSALGHYSKARALLVEALAEFEQARRIAKPDLLIDPEEWRLSVISRTEELNRVLDPQPRVTRTGVRFRASGLYVKHANEQLPVVTDGAKATSTFGEEMRLRENTAIQPVRPELRKVEPVTNPDSLRSLQSELNEFLQPEESKTALPEAAKETPKGETPVETVKETAPSVETGKAVIPAVELNVESAPVAKEAPVAPFKPVQKQEPSTTAAVVTPETNSESELDRVVEEAINERLRKNMEGEAKKQQAETGRLAE